MSIKRILAMVLILVLCCSLTPGALAANSSGYGDGWVYITIDPGHGGVDSGCVATYDDKQYTERDLCMQIGLYLKEELESYQHVKVFLTRTPDTPDSMLPSGEVKSRITYAQTQCSDFLISLHLNDVGLGTHVPNGACALVSNGNYRPEVAEAGKAVAAVTLAELEKLGVENKGFLLRDSSDTKYPNGTISDYYGVVRYGILANIPSTLIEHCFLRNESDFRAILSSDAKLRAVARADAAGIVQYFGLEKKTDETPDEEAPVRLRDIRGHWAVDNIAAAVARGWVTGYPDHTFRPNTTLTRADFVTLLSRLSGETIPECTAAPFPDVPATKYYADSVAWAVESGIVSGFPDGTFHPTENVTRQQMAHIMRLYLQHKGLDVTVKDTTVDEQITDIGSIGRWALDDVRFCYAAGLLQGRSNGFVPAGTATRAEAATVLMRLFDYENPPVEPEAPDDPTPETPADPETLTAGTPIYNGAMPNEAER
ncbi:MAG: S-layer homology domain-containing protein [Oscillospiraceae bacterium]|nr:S-layer homology domain-containing protein [Oscillospiraceae bacterium]